MVVEMAKESMEKKPLDGTALPGWTGQMPPAYDDNKGQVTVSSGKRCKSKGRCFLLFILFTALVALCIFFGISTFRYKHQVRECRENYKGRQDGLLNGAIIDQGGLSIENPMEMNEMQGIEEEEGRRGMRRERHHGDHDDDRNRDHDREHDEDGPPGERWMKIAEQLQECVEKIEGDRGFRISVGCLKEKLLGFIRSVFPLGNLPI